MRIALYWSSQGHSDESDPILKYIRPFTQEKFYVEYTRSFIMRLAQYWSTHGQSCGQWPCTGTLKQSPVVRAPRLAIEDWSVGIRDTMLISDSLSTDRNMTTPNARWLSVAYLGRLIASWHINGNYGGFAVTKKSRVYWFRRCKLGGCLRRYAHALWQWQSNAVRNWN